MPCETGWHAKMAISVEVHRLGLGKMPGVCKGLPQSHESVFKSLWATHAGSLPRWTHGETADLIFFFGLLVEWAFRLLAPNFFFGCRGTLPGWEGVKAGISLPGSRVQGCHIPSAAIQERISCNIHMKHVVNQSPARRV